MGNYLLILFSSTVELAILGKAHLVKSLQDAECYTASAFIPLW